MTADFPDFGTPPDTAGSVLVLNTAGGPLPVGSQIDIPAVDIPGPGYEIEIEISNNTSLVAVTDVDVALRFIDVGTGVLLDSQAADMTSGPAGTPHIITGKGPTSANSVVVRITNNTGGGDSIDYSVKLWNNSRVYPRHDWRTRVLAGAGYTLGQPGINQGVLWNSQPAALISGANYQRLLPLYAGNVKLRVSTPSGTSDCEFLLTAIGTFTYHDFAVLLDVFTDSHGQLNQEWSLPRTQCFLTVINHNAGAQVISSVGTISEQEP